MTAFDQPARSFELTSEAPWPGPAAYTERDATFFFGRQSETAELHRLVRAEPLCVLFGVSGLGKTSLLQAGLFTRLNADGFFPALIRLGHADDEPPLPKQVLEATERAASAAGVILPSWEFGEPNGTGTDTLTTAFHERGRFFGLAPDPLTPVLVFDQFEEAFTQTRDRPAARERVEHFLVELSQLLDANATTAPLRVVLSLREDHLATLESLRHLLPGVRRARLRLLPFTVTQSREVVLGPGAHLLDEAAADAIVETFATADDDRAGTEPVLLSLFCWQLNHERLAGPSGSRITRDRVEALRGQFLKQFYEQAFDGLTEGEAIAVRRFVEDELVDDAGYRTSAGMEHACRQADVTRSALDQLVQRRLLHPIDRAGGHSHLEIIHDRLADVARQSREIRRSVEERSRIEGEQAEAAEREQALQDQVRRQRRVIAVMVGSASLLVAIAAWALIERYRAEEARSQALAARSAADELISFLQYDLTRTFRDMGNLSLLDRINQRVRTYNEQFPAGESELKRLVERSAALLTQGEILQDKGDFAGALKPFEETRAIGERLVASDPDNTDWQRDLAISHQRIGGVLESQRNLVDALNAYQRAFVIFETLATKDPTNEVWQLDLSMSYDRIGAIRQAQGDLTGALEAFHKAGALVERLTAKNPDNADWQIGVSIGHQRIGGILQAQGDRAGALKAFQEALAINRALVAKSPDNLNWQRAVLVTYGTIGDVLHEQGNLADSLGAFQECLAIADRLAAKDPDNAVWRVDQAMSRGKVAGVLLAQVGGDRKAARQLISQAIALAKRTQTMPAAAELRAWLEDLQKRAND